MSTRCCSRQATSRCRSAATSPRAWLLKRRHRLRDVFERLVVWSAASGVLWLAGAALDGDQRLLLWIPALALELAAPAAGYWLPGRGRAATTDWDIEGGHFAERCQLFIIIALGESIVVDRGDRLRRRDSQRPSCSASSSRSSRPRRCGGCTSARPPSTRASRSAPPTTPVASRATPTPTRTCRSSRASSPPRSPPIC